MQAPHLSYQSFWKDQANDHREMQFRIREKIVSSQRRRVMTGVRSGGDTQANTLQVQSSQQIKSGVGMAYGRAVQSANQLCFSNSEDG